MAEKMRIMDQPSDFKKLEIDPKKDQAWEEGRRDTSKAGTDEVWYFDAILDDKSKAVVYFHPKSPYKLRKDGDFPDIGILITDSQGKTYGKQIIEYPAKDSHFGKNKCDIKVGPHSVVGDFSGYDIHIDKVSGVAADLHFKALVDPFKQGHTAEIALGDSEQYHYTDLNVTKSKVTGTLFYADKTHKVSGLGYHDHQWENISPIRAYHHWLWGHLYTDKYTVMIYDFVGNKRFGFKRVPFFGVIDNKTGHVTFMTDGHFSLDTKMAYNSTLKRSFPKVSHYVFQNAGDSKKYDFTVIAKQSLETRNMVGNANLAQKVAFRIMHISPVYMRYFAHGTLKIIDHGKVDQSEGDMIYEYNYAGYPKEAKLAGISGIKN